MTPVKSLQLDPTFKKSLLRRAFSNIELGNHEDALEDLRVIIKSEPNNQAVHAGMRRCIQTPASMDEHFRSSLVKHVFRRKLGETCLEAHLLTNQAFHFRFH